MDYRGQKAFTMRFSGDTADEAQQKLEAYATDLNLLDSQLEREGEKYVIRAYFAEPSRQLNEG